MKKNIFFDLDGTLINCLNRIYVLFCKLVKNNYLSYEQYWEIKRNGTTHQQLLINNFSYNKKDIKLFHNAWMKLIENHKLLVLDTLYNDSKFILQNLSNIYDIYIVTGRQSCSKIKQQLKKFNIDCYIKNVFATEQKTTKLEIIASNIQQTSKLDIVIGDTGEDIDTGKKLGIKCIGITTGISNRNTLLQHKPDCIYDNLTDFYNDHKTI